MLLRTGKYCLDKLDNSINDGFRIFRKRYITSLAYGLDDLGPASGVFTYRMAASYNMDDTSNPLHSNVDSAFVAQVFNDDTFKGIFPVLLSEHSVQPWLRCPYCTSYFKAEL